LFLLTLILLNFCVLIGGHPALDFIDFVHHNVFVVGVDLSLNCLIRKSVLDVNTIPFQTVPTFNFSSDFFVLVFELLGFFDQLLNLLLG